MLHVVLIILQYFSMFQRATGVLERLELVEVYMSFYFYHFFKFLTKIENPCAPQGVENIF